jgi:hypothetical protein
VEGSCLHGNEPSGSINVGKLLGSFTIGDFSRRVDLHIVNQLVNAVGVV